jgi:uncharacterized repeat protein (TIGR01451 family)
LRRFISYLLCISLVIPLVNTITLFSPQAQAQGVRSESSQTIAAGIRRLKSDTNRGALVTTSRATGAARFVRIASGSAASLSSAKGSPQDQSIAFFNTYGDAFGVANASTDLTLAGEASDAIGGRHLTYNQNYKGVPVFAGLLKTHFDAAGELRVVNGNIIPDINLNPAPSRKASDAAAVAVGLAQADPGDGERPARSNAPLSARSSTLYVYRTNLARGIPGKNYLVYEVEVSNDADVREFVYIDAHTLKLVDKVSGIHDAMFRRGYDGQNLPNVPPDYPTGPEWVEGDPFPTGTPELDNMLRATAETYNFFDNAFNRDSFDGQGATMDSIYNRGYSCPNASWNGTFISFCPGLTTDDVTAHEWGHAYTQYTHGLIYAWQPGALNESYSDMWGETVDRINGRDNIGNSNTDPLRTDDACSVNGGTPPPTLTVSGGSSADGNYQSRASVNEPPRPFTVGPTPMSTTVPAGACSAITNDVNGKIAVIDWTLTNTGANECGSGARATNAKNAGAAGIIFVAPASGLLNLGSINTIASVQVTNTDGATIKAGLPANATISLGVGTANSTRWLLGEDDTGALAGPLRDMWNPRCFGNPGKVSDQFEYTCSTADQGGVHTNSGVPNHAYALLVDGGTYNGQTITAIGLTKAAHIYYRAMTVYQHRSSDFPDHADSIEQSAQDLIGQNLASLTDGTPSGEMITAADVQEVKDAALAVELRTPPTFCHFQPLLAQSPPADACSTGTSQAVIYSDDFEGDVTDWTITHTATNPAGYNQPDWVVTTDLPDGKPGKAFYASDFSGGNCSAGDDETGVRNLDSPVINIPSTVSTPILRFDHYVAFNDTYDGGQLRVSVNGGAFTVVPQAAFLYNAHNATLPNPPSPPSSVNTNPLAGQRAWSGTDGGSVDGTWGTSVVDLSQAGVAAGNTVQLRYVVGTDGCGGADFGWWVDNVKVSACLADVDMSVTNTASASHVLIGDDVTYTIVATNNAATPATSVKVIDTTNSWGTVQSASVSQGSFTQNGNVVTANFGDIAAGQSATLTVVADGTYFGKLSNTAVVSAFEPDTTATTNNTDTENTRVISVYRLYFQPPSATGPCGSSLGTVRLTEKAPIGGVVVNLSEGDPELTVPATVTVPEGQLTASFNTTSIGPVTTARIVNVTASVGTDSVIGRLQLLPTRIASLTFNPQSPVQGGTDVTATVTLSCVASQDTVVTIQTTRNAAKPQVTQITIPQGQNSGQFLIKTKSPGQTVTAYITVRTNGRYLKEPLTVTP